jgi:hypothetical protein
MGTDSIEKDHIEFVDLPDPDITDKLVRERVYERTIAGKKPRSAKRVKFDTLGLAVAEEAIADAVAQPVRADGPVLQESARGFDYKRWELEIKHDIDCMKRITTVGLWGRTWGRAKLRLAVWLERCAMALKS